MSEWRPIATAPRDGTLILTWISASRPHHAIVYWGRDNAINPLGWIGGHCRINHIDQPIAWMPLPPEPNPEAK